MFRRQFMLLTVAALSVSLFLAAGCTPAVDAQRNLLSGATWEYSIDRGETWTRWPPVVAPGKTQAVYARTSFEVADPSSLVALALTHGLPPRQRQLYSINDEPVPVPLEKMYYQTIPGIPASLLRPGRNELFAKFGIDNRPPPKQTVPPLRAKLVNRLAGLTEKDLAFQTGPVLGAFGPDAITVTCRTNLPATVTLAVRRPGTDTPVVEKVSNGMMHRFRADGLSVGADRRVEYVLSAECRGHTVRTPWQAVTLPAKSPESLRFVVAGDSRSYPKDWTKVAKAIEGAAPEFIVFSGDMVSRGRDDWLWDEHFFGPSDGLFARVPIYALPGNHEEAATVYPLLFTTPGSIASASPPSGGDGLSTHWHQRFGDVLLVGSDTRDRKWYGGDEMADWLDGVLAEQGKGARFVFFFTHYPAYSSGKHGELEEGEPDEKELALGQRVIVPLLKKHGVTALVAGHDHNYERSEMPGLSMVTSGGAGAPLRGKAPAGDEQNPHSVHFASVLHYCLFTVNGDECIMQAIDLDGKVFDTRTWKARKAE